MNVPQPRDWQYVQGLAFRGDSRAPDEIFARGFLNRKHPSTKFNKLQRGLTLAERRALFTRGPEYRDPAYYARVNPLIQVPAYDVSPKTSVALTRSLAVAPIFPLVTAVNTLSWVYIVWVRAAFMTYMKQAHDRPGLAWAQEIAVHYVSPRDVIAAVRVLRHGGPFGTAPVQYHFHGTILFNVHAERMAPRVEIEALVRPFIYNRTKVTSTTNGARFENKGKEYFFVNPDQSVSFAR